MNEARTTVKYRLRRVERLHAARFFHGIRETEQCIEIDGDAPLDLFREMVKKAQPNERYVVLEVISQ